MSLAKPPVAAGTAKPWGYSMPAMSAPAHKKGGYFAEYEKRVLDGVEADAGEKVPVTFHTVALEASIGFVDTSQAQRLQREGFAASVLLYGPRVRPGVERSFHKIGDEAFPGNHNFNNQRINSLDTIDQSFCTAGTTPS